MLGFVAINSHRFHAPSDVVNAVNSTGHAVARAASLGIPLHVALFAAASVANDPEVIAATNARQVSRHPQESSSNGTNLNAQIVCAQQAGAELFFRVDGDDTVSPTRFTRQINLMATSDAAISGGGLIYRDTATGGSHTVLPAPKPGPLAFLTNLYLMHPTLCFRLKTIQAAGLMYWPHRLEDKELALQAATRGLSLVNDPAVYGTYNIHPSARASLEAAKLNLSLNQRYLWAIRRPDLLPLAWGAYAARRVFGAQAMRQLRNSLTAAPNSPKKQISLTDVQYLPVKKEQKKNTYRGAG